MKYLILFLLLLPGSLQAADQLPVLVISPTGYAWMIQGENGPVLYKFSQVVILGQPTGGTPNDNAFGLVEKTKTWLDAVPNAAKSIAQVEAIAKAFEDVAEMVKSGKLQTLGSVEAATLALLEQTIQNKAAWSTFGSNLNKNLIELQTVSKKIVTPADYAKALLEVAKGLQ